MFFIFSSIPLLISVFKRYFLLYNLNSFIIYFTIYFSVIFLVLDLGININILTYNNLVQISSNLVSLEYKSFTPIWHFLSPLCCYCQTLYLYSLSALQYRFLTIVLCSCRKKDCKYKYIIIYTYLFSYLYRCSFFCHVVLSYCLVWSPFISA
jgi:hypothetical protein